MHVCVCVCVYIYIYIYILGGGLVASVWVDQLRVPSLSPTKSWPLFFRKTAEWPKITHMLPIISSTGTAKLYASRSFLGQHEPLNKKRGVTSKILTCATIQGLHQAYLCHRLKLSQQVNVASFPEFSSTSIVSYSKSLKTSCKLL